MPKSLLPRQPHGVGDAARDGKLIAGAVRDLSIITGQSPEVRWAARLWRSSSCARVRRSVRATLRSDRLCEY
jgi:large subunit ribosomal protein L5